MRPVRQGLALVEGARDPGCERVHQRRERPGLADRRLAVADADLDRGKREVGTHAPPDLGVLDDRPRLVEEAHVPLVLVPAGEGVRHAAAGERPREDLAAGRVEAGADALVEGRARREGQQLRQEASQRRADPHRPVGSADPDVDVLDERHVAPRDVLEPFGDASVVRRVDQPHVLPARPGMRARARQRDPERVRELRQLRPVLREAGHGLGERLGAAGAHLDLRGDQLPREQVRERRVICRRDELLEAVDEAERVRVEQGELLLDRKREVPTGVELLARVPDLLGRGETLLVAHGAVTLGVAGAARPRSPSSSCARPHGAPRPPAPPGRC